FRHQERVIVRQVNVAKHQRHFPADLREADVGVWRAGVHAPHDFARCLPRRRSDDRRSLGKTEPIKRPGNDELARLSVTIDSISNQQGLQSWLHVERVSQGYEPSYEHDRQSMHSNVRNQGSVMVVLDRTRSRGLAGSRLLACSLDPQKVAKMS